jgi:chromosomal replication initiator protein
MPREQGVIVSTATSPSINVRIASRLARALGPRRYQLWFDRSARLDYHREAKTLRVAVPSRFVADWIGKNFGPDLRAAAEGEVGDAVALDVRIDPSGFERQGAVATVVTADDGVETAPVTGRAAGARAPVRGNSAGPRLAGGGRMNRRLEDFVVGSCNDLAYAAACRLAEEDTQAGHPLFIHGGCGLGKTHLLQGVCQAVLARQRDARVQYMTGEEFTNEYITAVRANKLEAFRRRIRRLDLLAVDDVHFIANKQATQQEFLHTFDRIELGGARVVLASDSHPKLIRQFSDALVSRCVRGMVVQINPPDRATRLRLVKVLGERRGLRLEKGVAESLADRCTGSVREVEGLLTKLHALASLTQRGIAAADGAWSITHGLIDHLLQNETDASPRKMVKFETIVDAVAGQMGLSIGQLMGRGRHRVLVLARALVIHLARQMTSMSYPEIAAAMGRRNHSTVITAAQRMERQLAANEAILLPGPVGQTSPVELVEMLRRKVMQG